ncbi:MAG: TRAP transporter large permease [Pseudochelatococcus sp.]|uniref:TRAP transporter large permease n=1 Tax=Pseudochelatococcus sp. TaxID=2020869 RepID=UPI003D8CA6B5
MGNELLLGGGAFAATVILIMLEVPVGVAMGLVGIGGCMLVLGPHATVAMGATTIWESVTNYTLTMLPLFVLMGNLAIQCGLSSRLFQAMTTLIGHRRGGLALATIGASAGFGMIAGSSLATTATMGRIALPEMERAGYPRALASGTVAAGGTLGILIPPSTILVVYAFLAEQSIRALMLATAGPVALAILLYCLAVHASLVFGNSGFDGVSRGRASLAEKRAAVREMLPALGVFGLVIGGLYSGVFTANETAAVGAAVVLAYGVLSRRLSLQGFVLAALDTAATCGALYLVLIAANLFNFFLALSGLPFLLTGMFSGVMDNPMVVILVMTAIYFVLGMLMDELAMLLLTIPLFVPICQAAGVDLVWFGIYAVVIVELGLITPPGGMNLFVLKTTNPEYRMLDLWKGVVPFIVADLIRLALLIAFPIIALWLPQNAF